MSDAPRHPLDGKHSFGDEPVFKKTHPQNSDEREEFEREYCTYTGGRAEWLAEGVYKRKRRGDSYDNIDMQVAFAWFCIGKNTRHRPKVSLRDASKHVADVIGHGMAEKCERQAQILMDFLQKLGVQFDEQD